MPTEGNAMKNLLVAATIALAAAAGAQASGNPIQRDPISVRVEAPVFLGPTKECPAFRVHTRLASDGHAVGSSFFCVSSAPFDEATGLLTESGTLILHLPGGKLVLDATIVDDLSGYPVVDQTVTGTVLSGGGLYRGASGSLSGGGTVVFDENGDPHPDSTLVVDLD
jgi:hypothetical protein